MPRTGSILSAWCRRQAFEPLPPDPQVVGLYITAQASGSARDKKSVSTIERRLSSLTWNYSQRGPPLDWKDRHIATVVRIIEDEVPSPAIPKFGVAPFIILPNRELNSIIARMMKRGIETQLAELIDTIPAVALIGPRIGKTTLALEIAETRPSIYLDLESDADRAKLAEPELYLAEHEDELVILDEVHRLPNLFQNLRGLIDRDRRSGKKTGRFLLLGPLLARDQRPISS